ncbi:MAG TPA: 50S ribosomal protein L6 [Thermoanaerobaculia bacterium]|nr:50S ribosomal protein L6 [Thermoanaerobaculia bacterium]
MSRIGKNPVPIPAGVEVKVENGRLRVKGPKGQIESPIPSAVTAKVLDGRLEFARADEEQTSRALHGLTRALAANAVAGVTKGFVRELDIVGVGFKGEVKGKAVQFALGYSHPIVFPIPEGITIAIDAKANRITVSGIDKQKVGQTAAEIRSLRVPDPYKAKGIKYSDEVIRRKVGKAGGK